MTNTKKTITHQDQNITRITKNFKKSYLWSDTDALSSAIKLSRSGLRDATKTIGNYLFSGPTGVGKTGVAKQLSITLGIELIRFDMSEFSEKHTISKLMVHCGYVGFEQGGPCRIN